MNIKEQSVFCANQIIVEVKQREAAEALSKYVFNRNGKKIIIK